MCMCGEQTLEERVLYRVRILPVSSMKQDVFLPTQNWSSSLINAFDVGRSGVVKVNGNIDRITRKARLTFRPGGDDLTRCNGGRAAIKPIDHVQDTSINNGPTVDQQ